MPDKTFDILIDIRARVEALANAQKQMQSLTREAQSFNSVLSGFAGGIAGGAFAQFTGFLASIPAQFLSAVSEGVKFNATLEGARLGIAAIIKQFDTSGQFQNFDDALGAAGNAVELLKQKALQSPATFEQLVGAFQGVSGAASAANIPLAKQVDLVVLMSQALAGLGIRSDQILQESRALISGNINEDAVAAKTLGITKEQVDAAKAKGELFDFLSGKLSAFAEAGARGQQSFTTQMSNISDAFTQLKGVATESLFEVIKNGLAGINMELAKAQTRETAAGIGTVLGDLATAGAKTLSVLHSVGTYAQYAAPAFLAVKAAISESFSTGAVNNFIDAQVTLRGLLREEIGIATTLEQKNEARRKLDEAIAELQVRQTQESGAMRDAIARALSVLEPMRDNFADIVGKTAAIANNMGSAAQSAAAMATALNVSEAIRDVEEQIALERAEAVGDEEEILRLKSEQVKATTANALIAKGVDPEEAWQKGDDRAFALRAKLQAEIDAKKAAEGAASAKKDASESDRESRDALREQKDFMHEIAAEKSDVSSDPFLTLADRNAQLIPLLQAEAEAHREAGDAAAAHASEMQALALTFEGNLQANLIEWSNSFGTTADQASRVITGTLNAAVSQTSKLITDAIFRTGNWEQALASVGETGVQMLIEMGLQMVIQNTLGRYLKNMATQDQVRNNLTVAASAAPAAAAEGGASWGANWILAGVAALAVIGLIIGALTAFHTGGVAGRGSGRRGRSGPLGDDEMLAVLLDKEGVFTPEQMEALMVRPGAEAIFQPEQLAAVGPSDLAARFENLQVPVRSPRFHQGGVAGSSGGNGFAALGGAAPSIEIFAFTDKEELVDALAKSTAIQKVVFNTIDGNRIELGMPL